jgi:hypothetical protein
MDRDRLLGGNPVGVIIRLVVMSIVVGIVLHALNITPETLIYRLQIIIRRLYDLGFGSIEWAFRYFLMGAVVVIPIWIVVRVLGAMGGRRDDEPRR